jgi:tetratricopeptide (TPR) repeat protein
MRPRAIFAGIVAAIVAGCAPGALRRPDAAETDPEQVALCRQLSEQAQQAADRRDWEQARIALSRLAVETPGAPEVHERLGRALQAQGRTLEAQVAFRRALALEPDSADALVGLGQVETILGRLPEALKHIDAAIDLDPARTDAHLARGNVLEALRRTDDALAAYFRALATDPASASALRRIAELQLERKQFDQALARLSHVLELTPDDPEARYDRGRAHLALGHVGEAVDDLRAAATGLARRADVFYHLALALERAQRPVDALQAAERAVKLAPGYADARDLSQRLRR